MKKPFFLVLMLLLFLGGVSNNANAGCWCDYDYCIGDCMTVDPESVVVTYTYDTVATDSKSIGSCPYQGATPPEKVCVANAGTKNVYEWQISGTAEYEIFGVSAQYGEQEEINANCGGPVTINSWCSCCHARARLKYKNTYKCGECDCFLGVGCPKTHCGTNKEYDSLSCDDQPACSPPDPCDPNCPG